MPIETLNQSPAAGGGTPGMDKKVDHLRQAPEAAVATKKAKTTTDDDAVTEQEEPIWKSSVWKNKQPDGSDEPIIELEQEPRHHVSFVNDYTKIITIKMDPNDTTLAHRHQADTVIVICMEDGVDFVNDVLGCCTGAARGRMEFGQVGFAPYTTKPCVHKITNLSPKPFFVVNVEVRAPPPISQQLQLVADHHALVKEQSNCRIYKLTLEPGQKTSVKYNFFYVRVVLKGSTIKNTLIDNNNELSWNETVKMGDTEWKEPCLNMIITNVGTTTAYEAYVCELV